LWEAFLLQMNDFDRFLERDLRRMLDPVAAVQPPPRRQLAERTPVLTVVPPAAEPVAEPVAVTISVTPLV
jgi:hypothetical protein